MCSHVVRLHLPFQTSLLLHLGVFLPPASAWDTLSHLPHPHHMPAPLTLQVSASVSILKRPSLNNPDGRPLTPLWCPVFSLQNTHSPVSRTFYLQEISSLRVCLPLASDSDGLWMRSPAGTSPGSHAQPGPPPLSVEPTREGQRSREKVGQGCQHSQACHLPASHPHNM